MPDIAIAWASFWAQLTPRDLDAAVIGGVIVAAIWFACSAVSILIRRNF